MKSIKFKLSFILVTIFLLNSAMQCDDSDGSEPTYVDILGIDIVNVDNAREKPFISYEPIKKEAYMIGIKYLRDGTDEIPYYAFKDNIKSETIFCNTDFDAGHPAGSDVTSFFVKTSYAPDELDYAFVLRKAPQPGTHSFKIVSRTFEDKIFEASTEPIDLY